MEMKTNLVAFLVLVVLININAIDAQGRLLQAINPIDRLADFSSQNLLNVLSSGLRTRFRNESNNLLSQITVGNLLSRVMDNNDVSTVNLNDYGLTSENVEKLGQQFSLSSNAPMLFSAAIANVDSDLVDEILNQLGLIISELLDGSPDFSEIIPDTLRLLDLLANGTDIDFGDVSSLVDTLYFSPLTTNPIIDIILTEIKNVTDILPTTIPAFELLPLTIQVITVATEVDLEGIQNDIMQYIVSNNIDDFAQIFGNLLGELTSGSPDIGSILSEFAYLFDLVTNTTGTDFDDIAEYLYLSQIAYEGIPQYDIIFTSLNETYLVVTARIGWEQTPFSSQVVQFLAEIDYQGIISDLIGLGLDIIEDIITPEILYKIHQLINNVEAVTRYTIDGIIGLIADWISQAMNYDSFPSWPMGMLNDVGVFSAIQDSLAGSFQNIQERSSSQWSRSGSRIGQFGMLLSNMDRDNLQQNMMGNFLSSISQESEVQPMMTRLLRGVFSAGSDSVINSTAGRLTTSLLHSLDVQPVNAGVGERFRSVLSIFQSDMVGNRLLTPFFGEMIGQWREDRASPLERLRAILTGVRNNDVPAVNLQITEMIIDPIETEGSIEWSTEMEGAMGPMIQNFAVQLTDAYQEEEGSRRKRQVDQQNSTDVEDISRLIYTALSLDFGAIGQVLMDELDDILDTRSTDLLNQLATDGKIDDEDFITLIKDLRTVLLLPVTDETLESEAISVLLVDVNLQLGVQYASLSNSSEWRADNHTDTMKVAELMAAVEYPESGDQVLIDYLNAANGIDDDTLSIINTMIPKITNRESIAVELERLRVIFADDVPELAVLSGMNQATLGPIYNEIDQQITELDQETLDTWVAIPGNIPKALAFTNLLDTDRISDAVLAAAGQAAESQAITQVAQALPGDVTTMFTGLVDAMEANQVDPVLKEVLLTILGGDATIDTIINTAIGESLVASLSNSMMLTYNTTRQAYGPVWTTIKPAERFLLMAVDLDLEEMLNSAVASGSEALSGSLEVFDKILNPILSPACAVDYSQFTTELQNASLFNPKTKYAIDMIDAWGKPPPAIFWGNFKWPGDIHACQSVSGDRRALQPDGTIIIEQGGIKGAWTMVGVNISAVFGGQQLIPGIANPNLEIGVCLPDTCNYFDIGSVFSGVSELGATVAYIKQYSAYPSIKGAWKTDSKFIGVSVFYGLFVAAVLFSTLIDKYIMLTKKHEGKAMRKSDKMNIVDEEKTNALNRNSMVSSSASEKSEGADAFDNKAYEANQEQDIESEKKAVQEETAKEENKTMKAKVASVGMQLIKSFSLYENVPKMMDVSPKPNQIQSLDGIRFLSMTWVMLGHIYSLNAQMGVFQNSVIAGELGKHWSFFAVPGGFYSVDSFYLMSGLLVSYLFLKMLGKMTDLKKNIWRPLGLYYLHRYLRLLPLYLGVILIAVGYYDYLGFGPFNWWYIPGVIDNNCVKNWWTNLLYINNFVNNDQMCNGVSWYLANDMQFYWIAPLFLIPLHLKPKLGFGLIGGAYVIHLGITGWLHSQFTNTQFMGKERFNNIYMKPYARIGPYLIGLVLGYILLKKQKIRSGNLRALCWMLAFVGLGIAVYAPSDANKDYGILYNSWKPIERNVFNTLNRTLWALSLGWIIFAANTNCGGPIGGVFSWPGWAPLSRLTFGAYLIHPVMQQIDIKNRFHRMYMDNFLMTYEQIPLVVMSYLAAMVLHLLLEAPMAGIEKLILPKRR